MSVRWDDNEPLACPECGDKTTLVMFVDLRRCFGAQSLSLNEKGKIVFEGWGDQVSDKIDYVDCSKCDRSWTEEEFRDAVAIARQKEVTIE